MRKKYVKSFTLHVCMKMFYCVIGVVGAERKMQI